LTVTPEVLVVGAGLSGLNAALELNDADIDVQVLEAADRVGGRILTLDFGDGPVEAGATTYGPTHLRGLALLERFDLETNVFAEDIRFAYSVYGELCGEADWSTSAGNRTVGEEREILPSRIDNYYMQAFLPFEGPEDLLDPKYAEYDIPFADLLRSRGVSEEALRLVNMCINADDIQTVSALSIFRDAAKWREVGYTDPKNFNQYGADQYRPRYPVSGGRRPAAADPHGESTVPPGRAGQGRARDRVRRRFRHRNLSRRQRLHGPPHYRDRADGRTEDDRVQPAVARPAARGDPDVEGLGQHGVFLARQAALLGRRRPAAVDLDRHDF